MSVNKREEILAQLFAICGAVPGITSTVRNRGLLDNDTLPAIILMDGDETSSLIVTGKGRRAMSPVLNTMKPQIFVLLKLKKPQNEGVGTLLNTFRGDIIKAISADVTLLTLIGAHGDIVYNGATTDLKSGMPMEGQMQMDFSISHALDPNA